MIEKKGDRHLRNYTVFELAEGLVVPMKISALGKRMADKELLDALGKKRENLKSHEKLKGRLLQLKFIMQDYLSNDSFDSHRRFGYFLRAYIRSLNLKDFEMANEIDIKPAVLSQYINNHRKPPENIFIRLELHSHKTIPAIIWYQIALKEELHVFETDVTLRKNERKYVKVAAIEN